MIVYGLDIRDFEYAYRVDGPWDPEKGLLFDKKIFFWIHMQRQFPARGPGVLTGIQPTTPVL